MKRLTVFDWAVAVIDSDHKIPVTVKRQLETIATAKSLDWLTGHGAPGVLESKLRYVTIEPDLITIYVK